MNSDDRYFENSRSENSRSEDNRSEIPRREFLRSASLIPLAVALGCSALANPAEVEAAIRKFILAVGPWTENQRSDADDFATRFLAARGDSEVFIELGGVASGLAAQEPFRAEPMGLADLDLSGCTPAEKKLLLEVVTQIYGLLEVHHLHVAGIPDFGFCAGREQYTRPPSEWTAPYRKPS